MVAAKHHTPHPVCSCQVPNCGCAGGMHTYVEHYSRLVRLVKPRMVFEWGPGPNTVIALKLGAQVVSVEPERKWIPDINHQAWTCILAREDSPGYMSLWHCQSAAVFFIDSRRREDCLELVYLQSRPDAIAVLHDAQRRRYQRSLERFPYVIFVDKGVAFASRSKYLLDVVDRMKPVEV